MKNKDGEKRRLRVNGFIVFSTEYRRDLVAENPRLEFGDISRIVGKKWRGLSTKERKKYQKKAKFEEEKLKNSLGSNSEVKEIQPEIIDLVDDDENMVARKSSRTRKSTVVYQSAEPQSKIPKSQKSVPKATASRRSYRQDVDLLMECFEEELSSAQLAAIKLAEEEHEKANDLIKEFRAGRILVPSSQPNTFTLAASKTSQQSPQAQVVNESANITDVSEPQNTGGLPPPRPAQFLHKQHNEINKARGSGIQPDVILISDNQAMRKLPLPSTSSVQLQNMATLNVQPSGVHVQSMPTLSISPSGLTPQQVYKFVNVPNTVAPNLIQNQWALKPILNVSPHPQSNQSHVVPHPTQINQGLAATVQPSTNFTTLKSSLATGEDKKSLKLEVLHTQPFTECDDRLESLDTSMTTRNLGMNLSLDGQPCAHQTCKLCSRRFKTSRSCCKWRKKKLGHYQGYCKSLVTGNNCRTSQLLLKRCRNVKPGSSFISYRRIFQPYSEYVVSRSKTVFDTSTVIEDYAENSVFEIDISDNSDSLVHKTGLSGTSWDMCQKSTVHDSDKCSVQCLDNLHDSDKCSVQCLDNLHDSDKCSVQCLDNLHDSDKCLVQCLDNLPDVDEEHENFDLDFQSHDNAWDVNSISHLKNHKLENSCKEDSDLEYENDARSHLDDLDIFENSISCGINDSHCSISDLIKLVESSKYEDSCKKESNDKKIISNDLDTNEINCSSHWLKKRSDIFNDFISVPQSTQQVYVLQVDKTSAVPRFCVDTSVKSADKFMKDKSVEKMVKSHDQSLKHISAETNDVRMVQTPPQNSSLTSCLSKLESNENHFVTLKDFDDYSENISPDLVQGTDVIKQVECLTEDSAKLSKEACWYENVSVEDIQCMIFISNNIGYTKTSKLLQVPKTKLLRWKRLLRKTFPLTKLSVPSSYTMDDIVLNTELTELQQLPCQVSPFRNMHPTLYKKVQELPFFKSAQPVMGHGHILDKETSCMTSLDHCDVDNVDHCIDLDLGACEIIESDEESSLHHSKRFHKNKKGGKTSSFNKRDSVHRLGSENSCIGDILESDDVPGCTTNELNLEVSMSSSTGVKDLQPSNNGIMDNVLIIPDSLTDSVKVDNYRIQHEHRYQKKEGEVAECHENITMHMNDEADMIEEDETAGDESFMSIPVEIMTEVEGRTVQVYKSISWKKLLKCLALFGFDYVSKKYSIPSENLCYRIQVDYWVNQQKRHKEKALIYGVPLCYVSYHSLKMKDLKNIAVCQFCQKLVDLRGLEYHEVFNAEFVKYVLQNDFFRQRSARLTSSEIDFEISKVRSYMEQNQMKDLYSFETLLILQSKIGVMQVCKNFPVPYSTLYKLKLDCKTFVRNLCCLQENLPCGRKKVALDHKLKMKIASYRKIFGDDKVRKYINVGKSTLQLWSKVFLDGGYDIDVTDFTSDEIDELIKKRYLNEKDRFKFCSSVFNEPEEKFGKNTNEEQENTQVISGVSEVNNVKSKDGHVIQTTFPNRMEILIESDDNLDDEHFDNFLLDEVESEDDNKLVIDEADQGLSLKENNGLQQTVEGLIDVEKCEDDRVEQNEDDKNNVSADESDDLVEIMSWNVDNGSVSCLSQECENEQSIPEHNNRDVVVDVTSNYSDVAFRSCPTLFDSSVISGMNKRRLSEVCDSKNTCKKSDTESVSTKQMKQSVDTTASTVVKPKLTVNLNEVIYISDTEDECTTGDKLLSPSEIKSEPFNEDFDAALRGREAGIVHQQRYYETYRQPPIRQSSEEAKDRKQSDQFEISQLGMGNENDKTSQGFGVQSNSSSSNSGACGSTPNLSNSNNFSGNPNMMPDMPQNVQIVGTNDLIPGEEYILLDPRVLSTRSHSVQTLSQPRIIRPPMRKLSPPSLSVSTRSIGPTPVHIVQNLNVRRSLSTRCLTPNKPPPLRAYHSTNTSLENIGQTATNSVSTQQSLLSGNIVYEEQYTHPSVPSSCSILPVLSTSPPVTSNQSRSITNTVTSSMSSPNKVVNTTEPLLPSVLDASCQATEVCRLVSLSNVTSASSKEEKTVEKGLDSRDNYQHIVASFKETPLTQEEQSQLKNVTIHDSAMKEHTDNTVTRGKKLATSESKDDEVLVQKPAVRNPPKRLMKIISESEEYLEKEKLLLQTIKKQKESNVDKSDGSAKKALPAASTEVIVPNTNRITSLIERMVTRVSRQSSVQAMPSTNISAKVLNTSENIDQLKPQTASQILFGSSTSPKKTQSPLKSVEEETYKESMNKPSTSGISGKRDLRKSPITTREIESSDDSVEESSDESTFSCYSSPGTSDVYSNNSNNGGSEALSAKLKSILNADIFTVIDSGEEDADDDKNDDEYTATGSQSEQNVRQDKCLTAPDKNESLSTSAITPSKEKQFISSSQQLPAENEVMMKRSVQYSVGIRKKLAKLGTIFSLSSLHRKYGINIGTLSMWRLKYHSEDVEDLQLTQDELDEIESMKKLKEILKKDMEIRKDEGKAIAAVPSNYQIYVDNPEEELVEETVHVSNLPGAPSKLSAENKKPLWASKSKQPSKKIAVSNPLYFCVEADAPEEVKSRVRENIRNVQGDDTKDSCGVFQSTVECKKSEDTPHTVKSDAIEERFKLPLPADELTWEKTVYFCSIDGVFKYKYEPKKKATDTANDNKEVSGSYKSVLDSLFNKHIAETSNRPDKVPDRRNQPSLASTDSSSSEIAEILRKVPKTKANLVIRPSDTGSTSVQCSDEFKSKVVCEARKSGFENTAKWFKVSIADIMKWHDSLLDECKQKNVTNSVPGECVDDSVDGTESDSNEFNVPSSGNSGKLNSNLSFERFQVKEGTIKKPKFNSNPVPMLHPTQAESLSRAGPSSPKQFRTRMGPNSIKFAARASSDQLHQFKADVQGDLGIMPKFVKHSITKEKKDGIEIASTWKQVQSIINPPKISDKKYSQEYKSKIIRECEIKGQKSVSLEHKIPYNEISRWRLEAKRAPPLVKVKIPHGLNKADTVNRSATAQGVNAEAQKVDQSLPEEARLTGEPESLKIKIKLSSISSLNKPKNIAKKQKAEKISNSNMVDKKVEDRNLTKAATTSSVQAVKRIRESVLFGGTEDSPGPVDEDIDHRMEVINFCFEHGVLKTQKRYNVTRQSIIDLMKEYDELNKFAVDRYNQSQGFKTKLISREKTSVEVTNTATKPVIVKNLNDYIVTPEYMQVVVDYAVKHGITAASRKFKRKTSTVRSWINQFQKEEKKKISVEQVAKEQELLAANVSIDEARKISVLEARRKRQLLEAEFRRHIIEFAREFGITAASRRFKKKASTVKSWMGHFAKSERDAKRLEGASKVQNPGVDSGNLIKGSSGSLLSLSADVSNTAKVNSPPCSPIWEQDFVIKPSSSESPLKLTLSPRRKSVIVIDSSCEEETQDEETNDIVTEDEQESDFVELAAWEFDDNSVNNTISKGEVVHNAENLTSNVINVVSDGKKLEKPDKDVSNTEHEATVITEDNSNADVIYDLTTDKVVPNEVDKSDPDLLANAEENVKANTQGSSVNNKGSETEEKATGESMETDSEEIPPVLLRNTLKTQVYTDEVDTFFLNENITLKCKVRKVSDKTETHVQNASHEDTKGTCTKKFRKYADAEIMQNIDETCLFNETRLTRNTVKAPVGGEVTDKEKIDENKELDTKAPDATKSPHDCESMDHSADVKVSTDKLNNSGHQVKTERSLFDLLANESEVSSNAATDLSLDSAGIASDNRHQGLFGNLLKNLQIPSMTVKDNHNDTETTKDADVSSEQMPHITEKVAVVENKPKDITERNLFDFITPDTGKEEVIPTSHSSEPDKNIYKSDKDVSVTLQKFEKSSELKPKQRKPMFKFPKLASQFNFGNIAKLGMAKIKGENKEMENQNSVIPETDKAVKAEVIDIPIKSQDEKKVEVSPSVKADETNSVVMETFEELRKRLAQERAAMKLLKEKAAKSPDEEKKEEKVEEVAEKSDDQKAEPRSSEEIDYEMYKDFSPQKIILILDISKKHGVEFASTSFGLPVPVIVNWIIEKDRKHRKVAMSVTLEEKLKILCRMKENDKEKLANELGHKVSDFDQWENEVGWMIHNKGVSDVLKKWQTVESVVSLNFEEKTKHPEKKVDVVEDPSLSCNLEGSVADSEVARNVEEGNNEMSDLKQDLSVENPTESSVATSAVNNVPDILDFVCHIKPRDFSVEQKAIIVLLSEKYGSCTVSKKTGVNQGTLFNWRHKKSSVQQYLRKQSGQTNDEKQSPKMVEQHRDKSSRSALNTLRETRSSSTSVPIDDEEKKASDTSEKVLDDTDLARRDSDEENDRRKGYRVISSSKLPSVLKNIAGISVNDYSLEQKVAIVKLVELYGVRTIHKQFRIPAGSIWNWQHSKAVTQQLRCSVVEESNPDVTREETAVEEGKVDDVPFSIDSILDRSLIVSDSVNHLNFQLDQKADVVFLIQHFGCDYICEKMPQIPRGTLWNWRHNKNILSLVEKLNSKVKQSSKAFSGDSLIEETVNKTDLTQKWLKDLQDTTLETKRKAVEDSEVRLKVKKTSQGMDTSGSSKILPRPKPKIGPKCSKRNQRSLSPSTMSSEISVHSNDVEEIVSDDELSSVMSKRSSGSSKTVQSEQILNKYKKESSPNKSDVSSELETHSVKFDVVKTEIESTNRMMVCYTCDSTPETKRLTQTESTFSPTPAKKRVTKVGDTHSDNWIPLDEYYYGTHDGDVSYTEEKGEYRFKCWYCSKMLYNNVRAMQHIQGHIDTSKQQNIDLSDLTQCKHCYKQFDTPFDMQTHVEKVHLSNKVLMCRICEKDFPTQKDLMVHMKNNHHICEMPYVCHLCDFRSSMYSDVVDHFKKKHDSSHFLLCLYCLRTFEVKFVNQGWGQTQTYYGHLLKHQAKSSTKKCAVCRLTFFNSVDVKSHRKNCHDSNPMHMQALAEGGKSGAGMQQKKGSSLKSLNAPSISRIQDYGEIIFPRATNNVKCVECKMIMSSTDHYKKYVHCTMCRFATSCSVAYANHMMGFHSGQMSSLNLNIPWERPMKDSMHCDCNFSTKYGNKMANHLVYCGKRTCYSTKPISTVVSISTKNPDEEKQAEEGSLLDMLGLVQKKTVVPKSNVTGIHDSIKKETEISDVQKFDVKDEQKDDKTNKTDKNSLEEDLMEDKTTEDQPEPVDKSPVPADTDHADTDHVSTKDEDESPISDIQTDKPSHDPGSSMDDVAAEKLQEATESLPESEKVENESEEKKEVGEDDDLSEKKVTSPNVNTGDKSDCEVLKDDTAAKYVSAEFSMDDKNDNKADINLSDNNQETLEESEDDKMDTGQTMLERKSVEAEKEMATAAILDTDKPAVADELIEEARSDTDNVENKMEVSNEEELQDVDDKAEDSSLDKEGLDVPSKADSMEKTDEEPREGPADVDDNKKLEDKSSADNKQDEPVDEIKNEEQKSEREESQDRVGSDRHSNTQDDKHHHGNQSQGSSHRSDPNRGRDSTYDRDRDRDRSHDRDRDRDRSHDRDRDRSHDRDRDRDRSHDRDRDRNRSYDRDRDQSRHRDRDYNRSGGYGSHDNRDYRGHQGQHGGYHSNRDYQDRNRGGHHQDRGYNRNYQNRGGGYNQNYRGGYGGRYR